MHTYNDYRYKVIYMKIETKQMTAIAIRLYANICLYEIQHQQQQK